jgi:hypothetical protein
VTMNQTLREALVFSVLFALPFASAFVVEWWATFLLCPLSVIGLVGLSESVGSITWPRRCRDEASSASG